MTTARAVALAALVLGCGCGRYADFSLPAAAGGDPQATFEFEAYPQPVLIRGAGWESHDVLNPSVVRDKSLINFYSGFDGRTWRSGTATSGDGLHWTKTGMVIEPDARTWEGSYIAANGSALMHDGDLWYWYVAGARDLPRIGLWRKT